MPDAWQVLGLEPGSPWPEVRARWRRLCKELHPDRHDDPAAARRLAEVNAAYSALGEHDRRATIASPDLFEALLQAACDVGDVTDADEPCSIDMRVGAGWARVEIAGNVLSVDTMHADADAVCDALVTALGRYLDVGRGGR